MVTKNLDDFQKKMDFGPKNCIFGPKFCIFLRYTYETPIFSGQTHRTGLITCPPYPEVTLDTFGFPVDGRLAARRAVSRPRLPKVALFGPKSGFFGQKSIFCPHPPISSLPSWPDTKKTTFLCRSCCWTSSWGAARAHFWPKNSPKIRFFYATPIKSLFFGLRRTWLNEIITSTYPEVTLDTFSFPEGGRLAARQAVVWPQLPKMALFGTKNAYYSIVSHGIVWYCMVLLCILWYCIVLHVIALYRMVLQGIVLLASARGLYLARHLPTLCKSLEETFENTQWRKVEQMQPMWLCIILCKRFEDTFENTQWRKAI